jgi:hypothetical protein
MDDQPNHKEPIMAGAKITPAQAKALRRAVNDQHGMFLGVNLGVVQRLIDSGYATPGQGGRIRVATISDAGIQAIVDQDAGSTK